MDIRKKTTIVVLAATIATASIGAYAAKSGTSGKVEAFQNSRVTATQAIGVATRKVTGQASEVDFKYKNGKSYYEVEVVSGSQKHEIQVDAVTGTILNTKVEAGKDKDKAKPQVAISLQQAISAAEAKTKGKAQEADLKNKDGQIYYKVETITGTQKHDVKVDANNGQILAVQANQ